jgi:Protein of unknown function (DUF998)
VIIMQTETKAIGTRPALLACGAVAGPLYVGVALLQVLTRDGFDLRRHPLSLLSLGDLGWVQIANFVVSGLLAIAFAVGSRRVLHPGRAGTWGPLLLGLYGRLPAGGPGGRARAAQLARRPARRRPAAGLPLPDRGLLRPGPPVLRRRGAGLGAL